VITAGLAVFASVGPGCREASDSASITVREVIDGDTVVLDVNGRDETVRLIGVDTPETKHPTKPVECFGPEASDFTKRLLSKGTSVRIERDRELRDHFGRLLVYLYRADDGAFVNLELARNGLARTLPIAPNTAHAADFAGATGEAQGAGRGLWAACDAGS
jgi:micrococcal nuclease